eukprot:753509-Hanusia_phi.AAC.1
MNLRQALESMRGISGSTVVITFIRPSESLEERRIEVVCRMLSETSIEMPKEYTTPEVQLISCMGQNQYGQLMLRDVEESASPLTVDPKILSKYELSDRTCQISSGWYHGILVAKRKWNVGLPPVISDEMYRNEKEFPTKRIAEYLVDWASAEYRKTARRKMILPDDAEQITKSFGRNEILGMYVRMVETRSYGSAKKECCTFSWGMNTSGQLGIGNVQHCFQLHPIESLAGIRIRQVACGGFHTVLLGEGSTVLSFGNNRNGQLGNGTFESAADPQLVMALTSDDRRVNTNIEAPSKILLIDEIPFHTSNLDLQHTFSSLFGFIDMESEKDAKSFRSSHSSRKKRLLLFFQDELCASDAKFKILEKRIELPIPPEASLNVSFFSKSATHTNFSTKSTAGFRRCLLKRQALVKQIAAGYDHSLALLDDGTVLGWGNNKWGQLGLDPLNLDPELVLEISQLPKNWKYSVCIPTVIPISQGKGDSRVTAASVHGGGNHSLFASTGDVVLACGRNDFGQLGLGTSAESSVHRLFEIYELSKRGLRSLHCGASHNFAVLLNGSVFAWGRNDSNQLGIFSTVQPIPKPTEVEVLKGKAVVDIVTNEHTFVLCQDNEILAFGLNRSGQLGLGHTSKVRSPQVPEWSKQGMRISIASGAFHAMLVTRLPVIHGSFGLQRTALSWGYNKHGELGLGWKSLEINKMAIGSKVPVPLVFLKGLDVGIFECGWYHSFAVVNRRDEYHDGTKVFGVPVFAQNAEQAIFAFGYNRQGQLGLGHTIDQEKLTFMDAKMWGMNFAVRKIFCAGLSTYFLCADDSVWSTGSNGKGQLGCGKFGGKSKSPMMVEKLSFRGVVHISCGYDHCFAILSAQGRRSVLGFGANGFGQLGLGNTNHVALPTPVDRFTRLSFQQVVCGGNHTVVLSRDKVYSCGRNNFGQLGMGSTENSASLQEVRSLSQLPKKTIASVACGASHSLFQTSTGELMGCGRNDLGQLGLGNETVAVTLPLPILTREVLRGVKVVEVAASEHTLVRLSSGDVIGCGCNSNGQLGVGHTRNALSMETLPLDIEKGRIKVGAFHSFFICFDRIAALEKSFNSS